MLFVFFGRPGGRLRKANMEGVIPGFFRASLCSWVCGQCLLTDVFFVLLFLTPCLFLLDGGQEVVSSLPLYLEFTAETAAAPAASSASGVRVGAVAAAASIRGSSSSFKVDCCVQSTVYM